MGKAKSPAKREVRRRAPAVTQEVAAAMVIEEELLAGDLVVDEVDVVAEGSAPAAVDKPEGN